MKYETETNEPKKPTVVVEKSALEEFLEEWGSWRGKKKAIKAERDSQVVQPRGKRRKKEKRLEDSWWFIGLKLCGSFVGFITDMLMVVFSHLFSFKTILVIAAIIYFFDFDFKTAAIGAVGEHKEEIIQHLEEGTDDFNKSLEGKQEDIKQIIQNNESVLERIREKLDGIQIKIKQTDGTEHTIDGGDLFLDEPETPPESTGATQ